MRATAAKLNVGGGEGSEDEQETLERDEEANEVP